MNEQDSRLIFPSGRPIGSIKKDAKKLSKSEGIPLSKALDRLAVENGVDKPWGEAIAMIRVQGRLLDEGKQFLNEVDSSLQMVAEGLDQKTGLVGAYGPDLIQIRKEAIRQSKAGGAPLEEVLIERVRGAGYENAEEVATFAYTKLIETTFHVAKAGDTRLLFWVGTKSYLDEDNRRDLYVSGDKIPGKAYMRDPGQRRPSVEWADITMIDTTSDEIHQESEWYVCKYNGNEPRVPLLGLSEKEATEVQRHMGVQGPDYGFGGRPMEMLTKTRVFDDLRRYAKAHPRIVKGATGRYWGNWGDMARLEKGVKIYEYR